MKYLISNLRERFRSSRIKLSDYKIICTLQGIYEKRA